MKNNNNRTYNFTEYKDKIDELIKNKQINKLKMIPIHFKLQLLRSSDLNIKFLMPTSQQNFG